MIDILSLIPGKKKKTSNGWYSFNAVCCHNRGHRPDTRYRGGLMIADHEQTYHCFNCNFSCRFTLGKSITKKTRQLLTWLGLDEDQINKYSFQSLQHKDLIDYVKIKKKKLKVKFKETKLPDGELLSEDNPTHKRFVDYVHSRGLAVGDYPILITPNDAGRNSNRIIIPYTINNKIVGHISRYLDNRIPKYIKEQQTGYVFGCDMQKPESEICVVVEGVLDALVIGGCALTHDDISPEQAELLRSLNKKIIVVPDIDKTGMNICDKALDLGFHVAIPNWEDGVKDTNDAVVKYGKLPTLLSILQSATNSKIKIQMRKQKLGNRIQ